MSLQTALIEKLGEDFIKQIKPAEVASLAVELLKNEFLNLSGDADHDGIPDYQEIAADLLLIEQKVADIVKHIEAARAAKG